MYDESQNHPQEFDLIYELKKKQSSLIKNNVNDLYVETHVVSELFYEAQNEIIFDIINSEMFTNPLLAKIFQSAKEVYLSGKRVDILEIIDNLKLKGHESDELTNTIVGLSTYSPSPANKANFALKLREQHARNEIKILANEALKNVDSEDVVNYTVGLQNRLNKLLEFKEVSRSYPLKELAVLTYQKLVNIRTRNNEKYNGVHSGFREMDLLTDGFDNGDLILIGARPSMGKTAFALSIAMNMTKNNTPVGFFSIEMAKEQIMMRIFSQMAKIDSNKFKRGNFNTEEKLKIEEAIELTFKLPLFVDDSSSLTIMELRAKTKKMIKESGIKTIFVDYLGIMKTTKEQNREREIGVLSQGLKSIAKDFNIPVVVLAQLNRDIEKRADKKPNNADLRDSGSLEQDADQIMFINRPEVYGIKNYPDGMSTENIADIIVTKNRNGPTGDIKLAFTKEYTLFSNLQIQPMGYEPPPETNFRGNWNEPYLTNNQKQQGLEEPGF
jgi:replicative DNA helicase